MKLREYTPKLLPREALQDSVARYLLSHYREQISVEWPSPPTGEQWRITPQGWVGYIPLEEGEGISLQPKVPLSSLFAMLEYAYGLRSFQILKGFMGADTIQEYVERLAEILAKRTMSRVSRGIYRTYRPHAQKLPYFRGRVDLRSKLSSPWDVRVPCEYKVYTGDIEDNQIVLWTLWRLGRCALHQKEARLAVRRAYRGLQGDIQLRPFTGSDCVGRLYNRLNAEYQVLHALCRFFLDSTGPSHEVGTHGMLPFLVNMNNLFERFVYEWLQAHLPSRWLVKRQENVLLGSGEVELRFKLDLVLYDRATEAALCVLDTKYKEQIDKADIEQVIAYAELIGVPEAVLVYPEPVGHPIDQLTRRGGIRVRTLDFNLGRDLELAGESFLQALLGDQFVSAAC